MPGPERGLLVKLRGLRHGDWRLWQLEIAGVNWLVPGAWILDGLVPGLGRVQERQKAAPGRCRSFCLGFANSPDDLYR